MREVCRTFTAACLLGIALLSPLSLRARAQQLFPSQFELSNSVHLDEADSTARAHLERVKAYVADRQWDEAVETLRQVMETHGGKVIALAPRRYVTVADFCHVQLGALPAEALTLYRQRVDPLAQKWHDEGLAQRDAAKLTALVSQMFCSSWGDDALWALAELALEKGDYGAARGALEKLIEYPPQSVPKSRFEAALVAENKAFDTTAEDLAAAKHWYELNEHAEPPVYRLKHDDLLPVDVSRQLVRFWKSRQVTPDRLAYPETSFDLAQIRARLVLASILEGSLRRAREEIDAFKRLHPDAAGPLAGKNVKYGPALETLLANSEKWPPVKSTADWPTFAGGPTRTREAAPRLDFGAQAWPAISLGEPLAAHYSPLQSFRRVAEDFKGLLSYHPVIAGDLLLVGNQSQIFAFDLQTGKAAWKGDPKKPDGLIYGEAMANVQSLSSKSTLGVPRFTLTVAGQKLYARMDSQVTSRPVESVDNRAGRLVCLDLAAQGRSQWEISPEDEKWAFEGTPIVDGDSIYIGMRKTDVRPQAHVACFDAETGRRRWRTFICAAETPGGGQAEELTHNLLTLDHGMLYYNTNLGAVAAVAARDGQVSWITLYPRAKRSSSDGRESRADHFYRDLNPAIYYRGRVLMAPSDSDQICAFDATSGQLHWESGLADDTVHLLGVASDRLWASGHKLWWFDVYSGKVVGHFPDSTPPLGYGRGVLSGGQVYWPTHESLYVLNTDVSADEPKLARQLIRLAGAGDDGLGASGGNLVVGHNVLIIAAANKLYGFRVAR